MPILFFSVLFALGLILVISPSLTRYWFVLGVLQLSSLNDKSNDRLKQLEDEIAEYRSDPDAYAREYSLYISAMRCNGIIVIVISVFMIRQLLN